MKRSTLAVALMGVWSAGTFAADALPVPSPVPVRDTVAYIESLYQGEVVAIALDASGDKAAHYHVDLRYPGPVTAPLEVDAASLETSVRHQPFSAAAGWTTLSEAGALAAQLVGGQLIGAEFDATDSRSPHYDVDVRVPSGQVARLKVDPQTRQLGWRTPPMQVN